MLIAGGYYSKYIVRNHVNLNIGKLYKNMRMFGNNMSGAAARTGKGKIKKRIKNCINRKHGGFKKKSKKNENKAEFYNSSMHR